MSTPHVSSRTPAPRAFPHASLADALPTALSDPLAGPLSDARPAPFARTGAGTSAEADKDDAPSTARAFRIHAFGGPEVISLDTIELPDPADLQPGDAIVRVEAASINPIDYKIRRGDYPAVRQDRFPYPLGRDLSGVIEHIHGAGCGIAVGDPIYAMLSIDRGTFAERVVVKVGEAAARPMTLTAVQAAALPVAGLTAWQGLFDQGRLCAGQTVLIHAAAGGVGHLAVQFAKAQGAQVIATASGEGIDLVRELGADQVIDYKRQRFEDVVRDVDLVFDLLGGETQTRSWEVIREGGALISTLQEPSEEEASRRKIRAASFTAHPSVAHLCQIRDWVDAGKVRVVVQQVYGFMDAVRAQRAMEAGRVNGKLVLDMSR